jgi:hypothetical protein
MSEGGVDPCEVPADLQTTSCCFQLISPPITLPCHTKVYSFTPIPHRKGRTLHY